MKKFFLFILLAISSVSYAQILRVEAVEYSSSFFFYDYHIYLSNGERITMCDGDKTGTRMDNTRKRVDVPVEIEPQKIKKGSLIEKRGCVYTAVTMKKVSDKIIKYAKIHQVSKDFNASLYGSFSYGTFLSIGGGSGSISGNASGGKRTLVNIVFTDNTSTSIEASEDPIWLEAAAGMKVEHYKCGTCNIYKLLFN